MPDIYTHGHHESVLRSHRWRTAENSAGYLLDSLHAGQDLLDVGCGPGTVSLDLARRVRPGRVVGVDRAAQVVEEAERLRVEAGIGKVTLVSDGSTNVGRRLTGLRRRRRGLASSEGERP